MKKLLIGIGLCLALSAGSALAQTNAETIQNRLGVTGRIGFLIPSDSDFNNFKINTDPGFVGGGGLLYGLNRNVALEFDATHTWFQSELPDGTDTGEFAITNYAIGAQYRFNNVYQNTTPYLGAGLDVLVNDYDNGQVDTVVGLHISGGLDYFLMRNLAINAELKLVLAPEADIKRAGATGGNFDPSNFSGTFGVRYFFF